jgi:hypothetical protein
MARRVVGNIPPSPLVIEPFLLELFLVLDPVMTHRPPLFGQRTLDRQSVSTNVEA